MSRIGSKPLVVIGAGGFASDIWNIAHALNQKIIAFIDPAKKGEVFFESPVLESTSDLDNLSDFHFAVGVADNARRYSIFRELISIYAEVSFPSLIHPTVVLPANTTIGQGCIVSPYTVIGPLVSIGCFCKIGSLCLVSHGCSIGSFSFLGPNVTLAGDVNVGRFTFLGMSSSVQEKLSIGNNTIVGANSFLNQTLPDNVVAFGTPARVAQK